MNTVARTGRFHNTKYPLLSMVDDYHLRTHAVRFRAKIGASRTERALPQELVVYVDLELPISALPQHDHRREAVDYDAVVRLVFED